MVRFQEFERLGLAVAAISDKSDRDCSGQATENARGLSDRERVCSLCGVDAWHLVCARQVHGARIAVITERDRGRGTMGRKDAVEATDGLVTDLSGLPLAVFVADCIPIFLFDPVRCVGGIVHAGRRGTLLNIAGEAVVVLQREFRTDPTNVHALIGPSAGPCCYEVSEEMADEYRHAGLPRQGRRLDLWQANAQQLVSAGVPHEHITITGTCTICDGRFYSYRADGTSGRNMALLVLRPRG